jgi:hypothetical protein
MMGGFERLMFHIEIMYRFALVKAVRELERPKCTLTNTKTLWMLLTYCGPLIIVADSHGSINSYRASRNSMEITSNARSML